MKDENNGQGSETRDRQNRQHGEAVAAPVNRDASAQNHEEKPHLDRAPLAYENFNFLNSPDGRLIRIVAEYAEPLARFRRERIQDTVVFFGSARFHSKSAAERSLNDLDDRGLVIASGERTARRKKATAALDMARYYEDALPPPRAGFLPAPPDWWAPPPPPPVETYEETYFLPTPVAPPPPAWARPPAYVVDAPAFHREDRGRDGGGGASLVPYVAIPAALAAGIAAGRMVALSTQATRMVPVASSVSPRHASCRKSTDARPSFSILLVIVTTSSRRAGAR